MESAETQRMSTANRVLAIIGIVLIMSLIGVIAFVVSFGRYSLINSGYPPKSVSDAMRDDVSTRFADDYPGWLVEDITRVRYQSDGHHVTEYRVAATPPDGRFPIGIVYMARDDEAEASPAEEFLRPGGANHEFAKSLMEALQREYYKQGKTIVSLVGTGSVYVTVEWEEHRGSGMFRTRRTGIDQLMNLGGEYGWTNTSR